MNICTVSQLNKNNRKFQFTKDRYRTGSSRTSLLLRISMIMKYEQVRWTLPSSTIRLIWDEQNLRRTDHRWSYVKKKKKTLATGNLTCRILQNSLPTDHQKHDGKRHSLMLIGLNNRDV